MIINQTAVEAYIAAKGLSPRLSDADWMAVLEQIAALFRREIWHRSRLIHQAEDGWRRYSTDFPAAVPQPYRFIYYLEFVASESRELRELQRWLTDRDVTWREIQQTDPDSGHEEIVGLQVFGYDLLNE